jgi:hypothetical protein
MMRTWIAGEKLHVALNVGFWEEPQRGIDERDAWGILMADLARLIANAHEQEYGRDPREALIAIREAFEREIEKPTARRETTHGRELFHALREKHPCDPPAALALSRCKRIALLLRGRL